MENKGAKRRTDNSVVSKNRIIIVFLLLLFFVTIYCSIWNAEEIQNIAQTSRESIALELIEQTKSSVLSEINYKIQAIENLADSLERLTGKEDIHVSIEFLDRKKNFLNFDAVALIEKDGNVVATLMDDLQTNYQDLFDRKVIQKAFQGNVSMNSLPSGEFCYAAPIYRDDQVKYVVSGISGRDSIQKMITVEGITEGITEETGDRTYSCIVDQEGEIVVAPDGKEEFLKLYGRLNKNNNSEDVVKVQENLKNGKDGLFKLTMDGQEKFVGYSVLGINDWILLTIMPPDMFTGIPHMYIIRTNILVFLITLLSIIFFVILYKIYEDSKMKLVELAYYDELTNGINNRAFDLRYQALKNKIQPSEYSVVLLDIRDFKIVNQKYGSNMGDKLLSLVYQIIESRTQKEKNEFVTRSEMDRFFVFLNISDHNEIQDWADKTIGAIRSYQGNDFPYYTLKFKVSCCIVDDLSLNIREFQDRARMGLQNSQNRELDSVVFYSEEIGEKIKRDHQLLNRFDEALENCEFQAYLQPKVELQTGKLAGAEALVRWKNESGEIVPPNHFIPVLELSGKIQKLDIYIFEKICQFLEKRENIGKNQYPISVNLSRNHFNNIDFLDEFVKIIDKYHISRSFIEFELTETIFLDEEGRKRVKECINRMHELGFRCSMDDFGIGYSSLSLLREFDVDVLKLDRTFFGDLSNKKARDIISTLMELARKLNIEVVAEGIEMQSQIDYLRSVKCDQVQGYFFSRPLPIDAFEKWEEDMEMA